MLGGPSDDELGPLDDGSALRGVGLAKRERDMTSVPFFSIDNVDTQDVDQLSYVRPSATHQGHMEVFVAVADVVSSVPQGGELDARAQQNTTTLYLHVCNFWMFPKRLCCNQTSLLAGALRRAIVTRMTVNLLNGAVIESEICLARVVNHYKLNYDGVAAFLNDASTAPKDWPDALKEQLRLHEVVSGALAFKRRIEGSLPFAVSAAEPVLDPKTNEPIGVRQKHQNSRAHDIIQVRME